MAALTQEIARVDEQRRQAEALRPAHEEDNAHIGGDVRARQRGAEQRGGKSREWGSGEG